MKFALSVVFLMLLLSHCVAANAEDSKSAQITALKKRIVELKKELKEAEKKYEESKEVAFDQYLGTAKGEGGDLAGKIHVMRDKMNYEEEKIKIKKRFEEIKKELKSSETKLMVLEA